LLYIDCAEAELDFTANHPEILISIGGPDAARYNMPLPVWSGSLGLSPSCWNAAIQKFTSPFEFNPESRHCLIPPNPGWHLQKFGQLQEMTVRKENIIIHLKP